MVDVRTIEFGGNDNKVSELGGIYMDMKKEGLIWSCGMEWNGIMLYVRKSTRELQLSPVTLNDQS